MARQGTFGGFYFDPEVFTDYMQERDTVEPKLINSGVIVSSEKIAKAIENDGNVFTLPMYQPLDGDAKNYDGLVDNTPSTTSAKKQTGMAYRRMAAWEVKDFTKEISGADPMGDIASKVSSYILKNNQKDMLAVIDAVLSNDSMTSHVLDKATTTTTVGATNKLAPEDVITISQKAVGSNYSVFKAIGMCSLVYANLMKENLITFVEGVDANGISATPYKGEFMGLSIIIDDTLTVGEDANDNAVYTTYLLGEGALLTAPVRIDRPNYVDYDPETSGGVEKLYTKFGRAMHPNGFNFAIGNVVSESPTRAELGAKANYSLVMNDKNIAMAKIVTNG